jgi:hypothetical protein
MPGGAPGTSYGQVDLRDYEQHPHTAHDRTKVASGRHGTAGIAWRRRTADDSRHGSRGTLLAGLKVSGPGPIPRTFATAVSQTPARHQA